MSCCGHRSADSRTTHSRGSVATSSAAHQAGPRSGARLPAAPSHTDPPRDPEFEYLGSTSLLVTGPVTGRTYRFDRRGDRRTVSRHDAASLLHVPSLRAVAPR
jgi:hypothetical protein